MATTVVVSDRLRWHRSGGQLLETVGAIASFDMGTGMLTINTNSLSFTSYLLMLAGTLKISPNRLDMQPHPAGGKLVRDADRALYWAKDSGRNMTFVYTDEARATLSNDETPM